jgi:hypothetical protein
MAETVCLLLLQVPLELYKSSMSGVRKYLVRHVWDGQEESSIVSEAKADVLRNTIGETSNRFEHLTCFAGGMFVLGEVLWMELGPIISLQQVFLQ